MLAGAGLSAARLAANTAAADPIAPARAATPYGSGGVIVYSTTAPAPAAGSSVPAAN